MAKLTTIKKVYKTTKVSKKNIAEHIVEARRSYVNRWGVEIPVCDLYQKDVDFDRLYLVATIPWPSKLGSQKNYNQDKLLEWAKENLPDDIHVSINI